MTTPATQVSRGTHPAITTEGKPAMCRTGGRRCPSSSPSSRGGTRGRPRPAAGQHGDTTPPGRTGTPPPGGTGNGNTATTPPPRGLNIVTGNATVGGQYDDVQIHGGITPTPGGGVITGPITGTPSAEPTAGQAAAAAAAAARAMETASDALRAAEDAARSGHTEGDTPNVAGDGDVIAIQISGRTYRY